MVVTNTFHSDCAFPPDKKSTYKIVSLIIIIRRNKLGSTTQHKALYIICICILFNHFFVQVMDNNNTNQKTIY